MDYLNLKAYNYEYLRANSKSSAPTSEVYTPEPLPEVTALSVEQVFPAEALDEYRRSTPCTVERYQTVRRLLKSMVNSGSDGTEVNHWNDRVIRLPNINILEKYDTTRFNFKDGFISMVNRNEWCSKAIQFVNQHEVSYVYGTKGIGKSFAIYQVAARLMADDNYRVVYINNADVDIMVNFFRTLKLALLSDKDLFTPNDESEQFAEALEQLEQINKKLNSFSKKEEFNAVNICLKHAFEFYSQKNIELVFFVDQTNNLMYTRFTDEKVFCAKLLAPRGRVLLGGSANNEHEQLISDESSYLGFPLSFTEMEFDAYRFLEPTSQTIVTNEDQRRVAMSITGGLPIELRRFFTVYVDGQESFSRRLATYADHFLNYYTVNRLAAFLKKITEYPYAEQMKDKAYENFYRLVYELPMRSGVDVYDKRIIAAYVKKGNTYLKPINYLARNRIIDAYASPQNQEFVEFFNKYCISTIANRSSIGTAIHFLVLYFLTCASTSYTFFDIFDFTQKKIGRLELRDYTVVHFHEHYVPDPSKRDSLRQNTLFVPLMDTYPIYDCYYYYFPPGQAQDKPDQPKAKPVLFCFQITNEVDAFEHVLRNNNKFSSPQSSSSLAKSEQQSPTSPEKPEESSTPSTSKRKTISSSDDSSPEAMSKLQTSEKSSVSGTQRKLTGDVLLQHLIEFFGPDITLYEVWIINRKHWQKVFEKHSSERLVQNMNIAFFQDMEILNGAIF